ncbi:tetratricopeptide repeat protein [Planctomicrobium piriforme]|uniref:Tetratricopeptide repeat-containing protein n=1 Tax=Planctomicrobium piriforme TaxID=1576369 RepID=A0A1I3G5R0_9PLAN|nr:tetratricopeptide repeat protein [Planctomicrobium piriforme]SFI18803.1 Tetratricopeptide repeat-containing protein [Planctomicrobium piriforme]
MSRAFRSLLLCLALLACAGPALAFQAPSELDTIKDQADTAYRNRDFPKAIQLCDRALAQAPTDHVALYLRGSSRVELGILMGNDELVRQGIADSREGIRHEGKGKAEYYLPYIYGMSHLSALEGKTVHAQTARTVADSVLDRDDLTPEQRANLIYQRAQANMQLKDFKASELDLQEVLKLSPKHLAAHMLMADLAARTKTPAEAIAAYGKVVDEFPDNALTYNNRGMYLQSIGRTQEAIGDFNKAVQIDPKFLPAYINRGFALLENGDAAGAEAALTQAITIDPQQIGALSLRATARLNQEKSQDALADYRQVVQMAPQSPMAYADLGFAQFFTLDFPGALSSFKTALKLDSKLRFLVPWKLACEMRLQQVDSAAYQDVLAKSDTSRDWVDNLLLFQLGKVDATQLLQSVSATDQNARNAQLCEGYYFIGMELQRRGRGADAVAYFKQATQRKLPKLSAYRGAMVALGQSASLPK